MSARTMATSTRKEDRRIVERAGPLEGDQGDNDTEDGSQLKTKQAAGRNLVEILDIPQIQSLMNAFTELTGMGNAILDTEGNLIESIGWSDICAKFHRANEESRRFCTESDLQLAKGLKPGEVVAYKCKNSLWDFAAPIYVGDTHVGNIYTGQFFFEDEVVDEDVFIRQAERFGFDKEEYIAALRKVPRFSREKVDAAHDFLSKLATTISELSYTNVRLADVLAEQRRIEENLRVSEERYRRLAHNAPDVIYRIRYQPDMRVEFINPACEQIFGYTPEEILERPETIIENVHPDDRERTMRVLLPTSGAPESGGETIRVIHKDGRIVWCDIRFIRVFDGDGRIVSSEGIIRDTSDRIAASQELKERKELAEAATVKAQTYLDFIAHDLTNILSPVMIHAEMIFSNPESQPWVKSSAERIMTQIDRAASFIRNTKRLSESEKYDITRMEPVDLRLVFETKESYTRNRHRSKNFEFNHRYPTDGPMNARSKDYVMQIIEEILDNTGRHSNADDVRVDIGVSEVTGLSDHGYWRVEIADHGSGIPDKMKTTIAAEAFDPDNRYTRGIASSLSFMALIAERIGGRMHVEDRVPGDHSRGAKVILLLPKATQSRSEMKPGTGLRPDGI